MTTYDKTIRLARLIGLDHITDGHGVWRRDKPHHSVPWAPYEVESDLEPIEAWLAQHPENWRITPQLYPSPAMLCDAVLRAFDPQPEPTQQAPEQIGTRGPACVVRGSVLSGFTFHGPFANVEAAAVWCESVDHEPSTVVLLEPPEPTELAADIRAGAVAAVYSRAVAHRRHAQRLSKLRCAAERRARRFDSTNTELGTLRDQLADGKHATELAESALAGERQEVEHLRGQLADAIERAEKTAAINDALRQRCHLAEDECDKLREALADADRDECCAAYKAQQRAEIERLTDRNESLLAQVQRYSISESRLLDKIEEIAAGDTSEGAELQQLRQFRDSILANIHEHAGNAVQPFAWIDQRKFDVIKAAQAAERQGE